MERPPSVDALARSLAGSGLPHPILVDIARQAIADDAVEDAASRAEAFRRTLLTPVINATGVLLHTNLGRAPLAHTQPARAQSIELDLATGDRGSRQRAVGQLFARLCGAEAAMVVNNNAAAVLLVLAALAAGREVPVSRGESVEIGGGFRVPEVIEQSGATLVDVGTTNRTRLDDYRRAIDRPAADVALVLKVHPSNYRLDGFVEDTPVAELVTLGVPRRRRPRQRPPRRHVPVAARSAPAGVARRRAGGGPDAGRRGGHRDVQRRQAARRAAGRDHRRAMRTWSPAARGIRSPALCVRAGSSCRPSKTWGSPTFAARSSRTVPFWRLAAAPLDELAARARAIAAGTGSEALATEALPGAGSAPGATIPSWGVAVAGDHLAALRANDPPVVARATEGRTRARSARGGARRRPRNRRRARLAGREVNRCA